MMSDGTIKHEDIPEGKGYDVAALETVNGDQVGYVSLIPFATEKDAEARGRKVFQTFDEFWAAKIERDPELLGGPDCWADTGVIETIKSFSSDAWGAGGDACEYTRR